MPALFPGVPRRRIMCIAQQRIAEPNVTDLVANRSFTGLCQSGLVGAGTVQRTSIAPRSSPGLKPFALSFG